MDRLRIALVAHNRFPVRQPFAGGLESCVWHLARALARKGHDVSLYAAADSDLGTEGEYGQIKVHAIGGSRRRTPLNAPFFDHRAYRTLMTDFIGEKASSYDVIHNHGLHYWPILLAPQLTTPMLTTLHTSPILWLKSAIRSSGGIGSKFIAVSRGSAELWRDSLPDVSVVYNGINREEWPVGHGGGGYLVWFGRITPQKAPHMAIAVAKQVGMPLKIAGPIERRSYFHRAIRPHLGANIEYVGHLDQRQLGQLVGGAAVSLVTPTSAEPFGLTTIEALFCGTPVVGFAVPGVAETIAPPCGLLVPCGDVAAMAKTIQQAIALDRDNVRASAITRWSEDAMVDNYIRLYAQLAGADRPSRIRYAITPSSISPSMSSYLTTLCHTAVTWSN
ncbi:MAG: glycosyltransferase family 4 protein [Mycobacterium sp.]|nr:glycosyltransferase family 4 protein [Mycobacterium sp.]